MDSNIEINKVKFMLKPDWLLQPPIDFEHKKYVLLSYLKKCEERFSNGEVYPYFIELALHFANAHMFEKERKLLYTDKVFRAPDDELLIEDLKPIEIPEFNNNENEELFKINRYFGNKVYEYFTVAKSLWSLTFESTNVSIKRKKDFESKKGFLIYTDTFNKKDYIWEYTIEGNGKLIDNRCFLTLIYEDEKQIKYPLRAIGKYTNWKNENYKEYPIMKATSTQNLPLTYTLLPIFKRKLVILINSKLN